MFLVIVGFLNSFATAYMSPIVVFGLDYKHGATASMKMSFIFLFQYIVLLIIGLDVIFVYYTLVIFKVHS